jgi:hypothetical protein
VTEDGRANQYTVLSTIRRYRDGEHDAYYHMYGRADKDNSCKEGFCEEANKSIDILERMTPEDFF